MVGVLASPESRGFTLPFRPHLPSGCPAHCWQSGLRTFFVPYFLQQVVHVSGSQGGRQRWVWGAGPLTPRPSPPPRPPASSRRRGHAEVTRSRPAWLRLPSPHHGTLSGSLQALSCPSSAACRLSEALRLAEALHLRAKLLPPQSVHISEKIRAICFCFPGFAARNSAGD